jgi:hypothetical protein
MVDVSILFTLLAVLTDLQGMPLPGARGNHDLLLLLAQTALRYQPALVLYTAALYVASWAVLVIGLGDDLPPFSVLLLLTFRMDQFDGGRSQPQK